MNNLFLIQIIFQKLFCPFEKIVCGEKTLSDDFVTKDLELSFEEEYWYEANELPNLLAFNKANTENRLYVLVLDLPFENEELRNNTVFGAPEETRTELKKLFYKDNAELFGNFKLAELVLEKDLYFRFTDCDDFVLGLRLAGEKVLLYSTYRLQNFNGDRLLLDKLTFGVHYYEQVLFFDDVFLLIDSKLAHVVYNEDDQNTKPVVRKFFVESVIHWAETSTEQQTVWLKKAPTKKWDEIRWVRTEAAKDSFAVRVGSHEVTLTFSFHRAVEEGPDVQIKGTKTLDAAVKSKKLVFDGMSVTKITLEEASVLHIVLPQFIFEERLGGKKVLCSVFYGIVYEPRLSKRNSRHDKLICYPLDETSVSFELEFEGTERVSGVFKKMVQGNRLLFEVEVKMRCNNVVRIKIPPTSNIDVIKEHPELEYVYELLTYSLAETLNGALIKPDSEKVAGKEEAGMKSKTIKKVLLFFVVLFCLVILVIVALWVRKTYFRNNRYKRPTK